MWSGKSWGWGRPVTFLMLRRSFKGLLTRIGHPNFSCICTLKAVMFTPLLKCASAHNDLLQPPKPTSFLWQDQGMTHSSWPTTNSSGQLNPSQWKEFPLPATRLTQWSSHLLEISVSSEVPLQLSLQTMSRQIKHFSSSIHHPDLQLTQMILLSLQKSCEVLCLLSKMLCTWMFWV